MPHEEVIQGHILLPIPIQLSENYDLIEKFGSVGFGIVFKAKHLLEEKLYAVKLISFDSHGFSKHQIEENFHELSHEIKNYRKMKHKYIIKYITSFKYVQENSIAIIMKLAESSISPILQFIPPEDAKRFLLQICEGIGYLHNEKKPIHRDLKPQNLLILNGEIKICDFGIAKIKVHEKTTLSRIVGTPEFMAPELLNEEDFIDAKVDL